MKTSVYHPLQASLAVACHVILTGLSVMVAMVASGCSPLPAIQSARIVNGAGFGIELTPPSHSIEVVKVDTAKIPGDTARFHTRQFTHEQEVFWKGYFRLGFHERVEATFAALPYLLYYPFFIACANVKVALFDAGDEQSPLFGNCAMSLFSSGIYAPLEWNKIRTLTGGSIVGTQTNNPLWNCELVCMVSGSYYVDTARSDGFGNDIIRFSTANLSLGAIGSWGYRRVLRVCLGITGRRVVSSHFRCDLSHSQVVNATLDSFDVYPVVIHGGIEFLWTGRQP